MKKVISVLLALVMLFSLTSIAFAGNWQEEENYKEVRNYCTKHKDTTCKGYFVYDEDLHRQVGCDCCEDCPNYINDKGVALNIKDYSGCRIDSYFDIDEIDKDGNLIHNGDFTTHYYWKAPCCNLCTGKIGCKCNNTEDKDACGCPYCKFTPDHTDEKIEEGLEAGRNGFIGGIQTALLAVRDVMYELFDSLFRFLRLDDLLGKWPGRQK